VQLDGRNYLVPVDAEVGNARDVVLGSVSASDLLQTLELAGGNANLVILDACRNNPFAREWRSAAEGLAQVNAPAGTLIAYATAPGAVASDGTGRNGLYTQALLEKMRTPGLPVEELFKRVRVRVKELTAGRQVPWESSSLVGDFFFAGAPATPAPAPAFSSEAVELIFWDSIKTSSDPEDLQEYLSKYPQGKFAGLARRRLASLSAARVDESKPDLARMSEAYALRSEALYVSGDYDGAIRQATEAIRLDEKSARAYGDRCDAYRVKGQHDQAVSDCTEAIRLSPDKGWYHALRGEIYRAKGQSELAVSDCTEAIRLDPKSAFAFNVRGESYRKLQQFERALSDLNEAIRLMPKWSYPYIIRGAIYYDTKDYTRALADFSEGIRLGQNDAWAYGWRAIAYDKLGDDARAKEDRKRAAELKGKN
jgi:Flp pilus assembly protein TadD